MPQAFRQRGKKKKAPLVEELPQHVPEEERWAEEDPDAGPSWIVSPPKEAVNSEAPFGYVDADVKAYFRTVDTQFREWLENDSERETEEDVDPHEDRRMFLIAALHEMSGKERELSTDPDCSAILERMVYSMDDFVLRVFMDSLTGSYGQLAKHRFASHVIQTLLTASTGTIIREFRGIHPKVENDDNKGELRTATQLILDLAEELLPSVNTLVLDPFASHVVRALFAVLCPELFASDTSIMRSKKSAAWKAKQGEFRSVFADGEGKSKSVPPRASFPEFRVMARRFIETIRDAMNANEVRALASNKASSPVLQMVIRVEADLEMSDRSGSLMDWVLVGLITLYQRDSSEVPEESDYLNTLLRDTTSSHLLETLVSFCPPHIFTLLWSVYFKGKLARLAVHPVANFVLAKALERASVDQLEAVVREMSGSWKKIRSKWMRPGVIRALIERAGSQRAAETVVCEAVRTAFELSAPDDLRLAVPCMLRLQAPEVCTAYVGLYLQADNAEPPKKRHRRDAGEDPFEPKVAGALILQSLLNLSDPCNSLVLDSLQALPVDDVIAMAHHATASRVLDVVLDSPTVSLKYKRTFMQRLLGHYHRLVDDRIGSRIGDRCWATADTFLKEKIARSLVPHDMDLAASFYGKFFARRLNLHLLQRRPTEWRNMQSKPVAVAPKAGALLLTKPQTATLSQVDAPTSSKDVSGTEKRKRRHGEDEIDALFDSALGRKVKRAALGVDGESGEGPDEGAKKDRNGGDARNADVASRREPKGKRKREEDRGGTVVDVLSAIRAAPRTEEKMKMKKRKF
ncbi:ARM repeat-containing protein [Vararia minispora EC-137]|uniref:ARM repeat-containing protein n=1 Tax=Vararia minispora EC-137 TaxID=1314806 RepID=A0ACB8QVQ3_9AGAM|nr:ARM repeat-containing protein [Vararia minispora EC-137]